MEHDALLWAVFWPLVALMLVLDIGMLHRQPHVIALREAVMWSAVWIGSGAGVRGTGVARARRAFNSGISYGLHPRRTVKR